MLLRRIFLLRKETPIHGVTLFVYFFFCIKKTISLDTTFAVKIL